jgi:DNA-binding transcriptional LysR family regulator
MSSKKLPPLSAIVAFDAVVRLGTFTRAASELHLTQSAVSKQIKRLELSLGTPLFERKGNDVILTSSGAVLYRAVTQSLQCIKEAVQQIDDCLAPSLSISASSGIASYLVIPMISLFRKSHAQIDVRVVGAQDRLNMKGADTDFAIVYGDGSWKDLRAHRIAEEEIFAICTPEYRDEHRIRCLADLSHCDLIELESNDPATISTRQWMRQVGYLGVHKGSIIRVSSYDLAIKAALAGEGVALAWAEALPDELRTRQLCRVCDETLKTGLGEYLTCPAARELTPMAQTLWDWVVATTAQQLVRD